MQSARQYALAARGIRAHSAVWMLLVVVVSFMNLPVFGQTFADFSPKTGSTGTLVTLTNANFQGVTAVAFNGVNAPFFSPTANVVQTQVPAGATTGFITVTTGTATYTSDSVFTVGIPLPRIQSFTPTFGLAGTVVSITGQNLGGATQVLFNGTPATNFIVNSNTSIVATAPVGVTTGRITVVNTAGRDSSLSRFIVSAFPLLDISSFTPTQGPAGSTRVTIFGNNFLTPMPVREITINGTQVNFFFITSNTEISLVVPLYTTTGLVRLRKADGDTTTSSVPFVVTGQDLGFCYRGSNQKDTVISPTASPQTVGLDSGMVSIFKIKPRRTGEIYGFSSCGSAAEVGLVVYTRGDSVTGNKGNGPLCPTNARNGSLHYRATTLDTVYVSATSHACTPLSDRGTLSYFTRTAARLVSLTPEFGRVGDVVVAKGTGLDLIDSITNPRLKIVGRTDTTLLLEVLPGATSGNIDYFMVRASVSTGLYFEVCQSIKPRITVFPAGNSMCVGGVKELTSTLADRYVWSNGDTNRSTVIRSGGRYWVTVSFYACGYTSDTLTIQNLPTPDITILQRNDSLIASPDNIGYTWFRNGMPISGSTSPVLKLTSLGTYTAIGRIGTCADTATFVVTQAGSALDKVDLKLYPNPAARTVNLDSPTNMDLGIYDSRGAKVKTVTLLSGQQILSLEDLTPGLYLLRSERSNQVWRLMVSKE